MGADYFNPDEATRRIRSASLLLSARDANIVNAQSHLFAT
jgi:hypothetical protein